MNHRKRDDNDLPSHDNSKDKPINTARPIHIKSEKGKNQEKQEPVDQGKNHDSTLHLTENSKKKGADYQEKTADKRILDGIWKKISSAIQGVRERKFFLNPKIIGIVIGSFLGLIIGQFIIVGISQYHNAEPNVLIKGLTRNTGIESKKLQLLIENTNNTQASLEDLTLSEKDDQYEYLYCEGNGSVPGSVDITLKMKNSDTYKMDLNKIEANLLEYTPIERVQYSTISSIDSESEKLVASYSCLIDPVLHTADAYQTDNLSENGIYKTEDEKQNLRETILSSESRKYGLKLEFTNYGLYRLQIRVRYYCDGKYLYSESSPDLQVIYDSNVE